MLIDSHCHLDVAEFDSDRAAVIAAARRRGVAGILVPGFDRASWQRIADLADAYPDIHPAYGLHPGFIDQHEDADVDALAGWIAQRRCVAVGECGLDFYVPGFDLQRQLDVLRPQLALARALDLPLILHGRRAFDRLLAEVRRVGKLRGIVHSFAGSPEQARQWCNEGFLLGFGGPVTYDRAARLRKVVAALPLDHLVLETDAPDQPLQGRQGQRNEPALVVDVLDCVARLRGASAEHIAEATTRNLVRLLRVPLPSAALVDRDR